MKSLKIVFMGTPEFAVATLHLLIQNNYDIVGVITAVDKPAGRGRHLQQSAVKKYAIEKGLVVLQPSNLKDKGFLKQLKDLRANLQIVVAFRMLPSAVWQMPKYGTINLHASLLPNYRGAAPINWVIMNGETKTGVTTFFIDDKIDTGAIIFQEQTSILPNETAGELHDKLMHLGADLILKTIQALEKGSLAVVKQTTGPGLKKAPKIFKEHCRINWSLPIDAIYDHIRGLSPYPAAHSYLHNHNQTLLIKIFKVAMERGEHRLPYGAVTGDKGQMKIAVLGGYIELKEIQLPGKRRMTVKDVLNGLSLSKSAKMA